MVKSMNAAIAGLKSHQTKMDVLSNNIANVNTWGFKSRTTNFQDALYSNSISGSGRYHHLADRLRQHRQLDQYELFHRQRSVYRQPAGLHDRRYGVLRCRTV